MTASDPKCPHGCGGTLHYTDGDFYQCLVCADEWAVDLIDDRTPEPPAARFTVTDNTTGVTYLAGEASLVVGSPPIDGLPDADRGAGWRVASVGLVYNLTTREHRYAPVGGVCEWCGLNYRDHNKALEDAAAVNA